METIPNFPAYCATKDGKIWSRKTKRFLKSSLSCLGYYYVDLRKDSKPCRRHVHRLILETFIGSCPKGMECCHNNGISTDNRLENLRWDTRSNNAKDAVKHGTLTSLFQNGEAHPNSKLKEKDVRMIVYMYKTGLFLMRKIVEVYNVKHSVISRIINKKRWKHIWSDFKVKPI